MISENLNIIKIEFYLMLRLLSDNFNLTSETRRLQKNFAKYWRLLSSGNRSIAYRSIVRGMIGIYFLRNVSSTSSPQLFPISRSPQPTALKIVRTKGLAFRAYHALNPWAMPVCVSSRKVFLMKFLDNEKAFSLKYSHALPNDYRDQW